MATSNRVFVSPGVYTSEKDLSFVAQSVGVTTLGLAGETLKGPAFEPILIGSYDQYKTYFGGTSPEKYGNGNPKYELPYYAKSYLSQSNQLFVSRVLGLTGYKPKFSWTVKTLPGVNVTATSGTASTLSMTFSGTTTYVATGSIPSGLSTIIPTAIGNVSISDYIMSFANSNMTNLDLLAIKIGFPSNPPVSSTGKTSTVIFESRNQWTNTLFSGSTPVVHSYVVEFNESAKTISIQREEFAGSFYTEYSDVAVAVLRSRGKYVGNTLTLEYDAANELTLVDGTSSIVSNPFAEFTLSGITKSFTCSFDRSSKKFINKVFGTTPFAKDVEDFPIYVHEEYSLFLKNAYDNGYVRGLSTVLTSVDEGSNFLTKYQTAQTPWIVSEVRGGKVSNLFRFITISDGDGSNREVKISIANINLETLEFDVYVRDYNDEDDAPVVLDKFSRCSMNPDQPGYIAKKIGTSDDKFDLKSNYVMIELDENHPIDAVPGGFTGYPRAFVGSTKIGSVVYKTKYNVAGDIVSYDPSGNVTISNGDKIRKSYLGLSSSTNVDGSLSGFKGLVATGTTRGFHLSSAASGMTHTDGSYVFQTTDLNFESSAGDFDNISARKFTLSFFGGFDGWDIYRQSRTNGDAYILGKSTYTANNTDNNGIFHKTVGNSDYYAFQKGIHTFDNPESININVFSTPGINFFDHSSLVNDAIDMVEIDRADCLYIVNAPNRDTHDEVTDDLDTVGMDSNYSATYWPWIQIRDTDNGTQIFLPPTGEVLRNIALTDNVAFPWFAPAGYNRGRVNAVKAKVKLTLDQRDDLYKNRVNPIATFSDVGPIIWGNKTLQVRESALDRINVRRLLLRARKLISAVSVRLLFEQNDEQVRAEFERLVNPILQAIKNERGLTDFKVVVSSDPEDMDRNTLKGKIFIKPTRSLEFIEVEFVVTPTGASFENV